MKWLTGLPVALIAFAVLQIFIYYPQMPEIIASHFDGVGDPNRWVSKSGFFGIYLLMLILILIVFFLVPIWSEKRSNFSMNLPNRDFWLSPDRIQQTRQFFRQQMSIMGSVHLVFAILVVQLVIQANFNPQRRLDESIFWALATYFIVLSVWLLNFFLRFRKSE